jgi:hypothetical protein
MPERLDARSMDPGQDAIAQADEHDAGDHDDAAEQFADERHLAQPDG